MDACLSGEGGLSMLREAALLRKGGNLRPSFHDVAAPPV
jgi:hypothetical protein